MIKSTFIPRGKTSLIYKLWGTKEVKFTDGINIIFSPNGTGKSVMLKTLAYYTSCNKGGWSMGIDPIDAKVNTFAKIEEDYITLKNKKSSTGIIDIKWDGTPVHYSEAMHNSSMQNITNALYGLSNEIGLSDALIIKDVKLSQGQTAIAHLNYLFQKKAPDITVDIHTDANDIWQKAGKLLSSYVKDLPRDGKPTILLDEPDRSLDFKNQRDFWENIHKLTEKYQLIITSHSYFLLTDIAKDFNIIEIIPGYLKEAKNVIKV